MSNQQYDNTNSGVIFKNDRKETERHPDYKGSLDVRGEEFWISGWIKEGKNGKFISIAINEKEARNGGGNRQQSRRNDDLGDDPF